MALASALQRSSCERTHPHRGTLDVYRHCHDFLVACVGTYRRIAPGSSRCGGLHIRRMCGAYRPRYSAHLRATRPVSRLPAAGGHARCSSADSRRLGTYSERRSTMGWSLDVGAILFGLSHGSTWYARTLVSDARR